MGSTEDHAPFLVAELQTDLKTEVVSSSLLMLLSQGVQFALNFASIVALARILTPEDFGLAAMVTTIMGFMRVFSDAGLSAATVQREHITAAQVSNLFWVNLAVGGLGTALLAGSAPLLSWFYQEPRVFAITLALSPSFVLAAATVQHLALLKRHMRFRALALIQVASLSVGVGTAIVMSLYHYGYWSLVGMQLSTTLAGSLLAWYVSAWSPSLPSGNSGIRPLLGFGANLSASSLVFSLARGTDGLLIGRYVGSRGLGLYGRASALMLRPIDQLMIPVESVFVPALARVQSQPDRYRHMFLRAYRLAALVSFVFTAMLLPLSEPITLAVLGREWREAAPIFASFTLLAVYTPIASMASWLLTSQGRGREFLASTVICSVAAVLAFVIGLPAGPSGVALSFSVISLAVNLPVVITICGRVGPVGSRALWRSFFEHVPVWIAVYCVTALAQAALSGRSLVMQLSLSASLGLLAAALFTYAYGPARRTAEDAVGLIREWREKRRT